MSKYQYRMLAALLWLNLLFQADNTAHAVITFLFTAMFSVGALIARRELAQSQPTDAANRAQGERK